MRSIVLYIILALAVSALGQTPPVKGKQILVLLKQQRVFALEDGEIVFNFHCSTGRKGIETPTGQTTVTAKVRWNHALAQFGGGSIPFTLRIPLYDPKMKKVRRICIHAYDSVPLHPASNGCVRLVTVSAKGLFFWAEVGIPVVVIDGPPPPKKKS